MSLACVGCTVIQVVFHILLISKSANKVISFKNVVFLEVYLRKWVFLMIMGLVINNINLYTEDSYPCL